jgi:hypothetical protein
VDIRQAELDHIAKEQLVFIRNNEIDKKVPILVAGRNKTEMHAGQENIIPHLKWILEDVSNSYCMPGLFLNF